MHGPNLSSNGVRVHVIMPALDEERALPGVLAGLPWDRIDEVVVVDNGSRDRTAQVAAAGGARVVREPERGYGAACLAGIAALTDPADDDIVVFMDADGADDPADLERVLRPIVEDRAELVVGSRVLGEREPGALSPHARWGNWLATTLIRLLTGRRFTDLGPFRALRYATLMGLGMRDRNYGWTVEMQLKAARRGVRASEVPVRYRRRIGESKISGTVRGSVAAGAKILWTVARHAR